MSDRRELRIAALADLHFDIAQSGSLRDIFADIHRSADVLALCGDLTTHGQPHQMEAFVNELSGVQVPVVAVLGNHDCEADEEEACARILNDAGVRVLDGTHVIIDGVGFAGTKGFAGGFGRGALGPFGERLIKDFVDAALNESLKIEKALHMLGTESRVVLLHYSPIEATVHGEPEMIWPFLGSSRMLQPIETLGATMVFHGHAHHGTAEATTPGGIPVYNVALPLLREQDMRFRLVSVPAPERRHEEAAAG